MAVAYITANRRWFRRAAARAAGCPSIVRELGRAQDRPGLTASLSGAEIRQLAKLMPDDERVAWALERLEVAEASDERRRRSLHALTDRWRTEGRWHE